MIKLINNILFHWHRDNWKGAIKERDRLNKMIEKSRLKMLKHTNRKSE